MNKILVVIVLLFLAGCSRKPEEIPMQPSTPLLSAKEAKVVFERIDLGLKFTSQSNEYLGTTDHLYYADVMKPAFQVTINIGKREDAKKPLTNLYISISALKPLNEAIEKEITRLVGKYINSFLVEVFPNGEELSKQCALPIDSSSIGETFEIDTATCSIECSTAKGDGNPQYMTYLLRITEIAFQKELNQRIMGNKIP
jgi:hypothetical protein